MPTPGEVCSYRSVHGGSVFDATVKVVHSDGRVDVDVWLPDGKLGVTRHKVMYSDDPGFSPKGAAFPKRPAVGE
jgi:hypothetical protein